MDLKKTQKKNIISYGYVNDEFVVEESYNAPELHIVRLLNSYDDCTLSLSTKESFLCCIEPTRRSLVENFW